MFRRALARRASEGNPIRVGVVGAGRMGTGVVNQIGTMEGMEVMAIADLMTNRAVQAFIDSGNPAERVIEAQAEGHAVDGIRKGKRVATADANLVSCLPVDAIIEATGIPEVGAKVAYEAILHRKHIVMLNVEADVVVGPILKRLADAAGVIYTLAAGDQPGAICEMAEWGWGLGLRIVAAGRGTLMNPRERYASPDDNREKAEVLGLNPQMYNSFRDGTKAQTEMCAVANALRLVPEVRGMHEPVVDVEGLARVFRLKAQGGILGREGVVELANGTEADGQLQPHGRVFPGVFLVVTSDHPKVLEDLAYVNDFTYLLPPDIRKGPNFTLFRPFHWCSIETPNSVAQAVLRGEPTGAPEGAPVAEVITCAKQDLKAGAVLDGGGGYTVYGLIEKAEVVNAEGLLPFGFAYEARLTESVKKGEAIRWSQVQIPQDSFLLKLYRLQEATFP
ncbi:MAG: NAD(P)H-dependent oxidoreductase [Candidatus Methylomirabilales bacterium]